MNKTSLFRNGAFPDKGLGLWALIPGLLLLHLSCQGPGTDSRNTTQKTEVPEAFPEQIDSAIGSYQALDLFSGVVLVASHGRKLYHKAFGEADRGTGRLNDSTTLFDIGSMNKTFTGVVVKQLVSEGRLRYSDKLVTHISGFEDPRATQVTIRQLLDHRSGFGDYHTPDYFDLPREERKLQKIIERAKNAPLEFEPGTAEQYSNLGYVLLGGIIEKVTGESYFENVRKRIVDPLKLRNTYLNDFEGLENRLATGYYLSPLGKLETSTPVQDVPNPDGGFLSTAGDILTFYRAYLYDTILIPESIKNEDPYFQHLQQMAPGKATGAAGGFEGFNSVLLQVISDDLSIIVLANMDEPVAERIGSDILALYRGETPAKPQLPAVQNIRLHFEGQGAEYIAEHFGELTVNFHPTDPKDIILNQLGYAYLFGAQDTARALQILELNTRLFPEVANCWDSYGEILAIAGNKTKAIEAYQKALELKPDLKTAENALKKLNQ
jgi:CubicO group peptidase (beta-lactamase class C family)